MNRRAEIFSTIISFIVVGLMAIVLFIGISKQINISKGTPIGERQFLLFSAYSNETTTLFYVRESARQQSSKAWHSLGQQGGYFSGACGDYLGFSLWRTKFRDCFPSDSEVQKSYTDFFSREIGPFYAAYEPKISNAYDYSIKDSNIVAKAIDNIELGSINSIKDEDQYLYRFKPSYEVYAGNFPVYAKLVATARQITYDCETDPNFVDCVSKYNGIVVEDYVIKVGCVHSASEVDRAVKICAQSPTDSINFALQLG